MVTKPKFGLPLPPQFYDQETIAVARALLGQIVARRLPSGEALSGVIVETEAYLWDDPACHAFRGETPRCRTMFGPPGHAYVYFTYGLHTMLNIVCGAKGVGEAVLIRALEPIMGIETMQTLRGERVPTKDLTNGPGKLAQALGLSHKRDDGLDVTDPQSALQILSSIVPPHADSLDIVATTRIGISQAVDAPWRFYLRDNLWVSRREKSMGNKD